MVFSRMTGGRDKEYGVALFLSLLPCIYLERGSLLCSDLACHVPQHQKETSQPTFHTAAHQGPTSQQKTLENEEEEEVEVEEVEEGEEEEKEEEDGSGSEVHIHMYMYNVPYCISLYIYNACIISMYLNVVTGNNIHVT